VALAKRCETEKTEELDSVDQVLEQARATTEEVCSRLGTLTSVLAELGMKIIDTNARALSECLDISRLKEYLRENYLQ
jgi:hypothetical protein